MSPAGGVVGSTMLRAVSTSIGAGGQQITQMGGKQIITVKGNPQVGGANQPQIVTLVKTSAGVQIAPVCTREIWLIMHILIKIMDNLDIAYSVNARLTQVGGKDE